MIIERDVPVPVRGGVTVYADVFRPADERPAPPLIAWSPYGKHAGPQLPERYPDGGVAPGQLSPYAAFESPDPVHWTARGYAVVNADIPGTWFSGGDATFLSPEEAACGHDLIEWAGTQSWSNGRVGLSGVSYLTSSQWTIAATRPPHLAAINPWEGWSDTYREVARHGGIPETYFWPYIGERWGYGTGRVEDLGAETAAHPLFDDFWASKAAPLGQITVPGLRGRELVGSGPAYPGHVRGVRPDRLGAQMAGRARREEMGLLLQRRRPAAPAGVLRPLPAGPGHRDQRLAAGPLPGQGARGPRGVEDRGRLARARHVVSAAVPGRRRGHADPGPARRGRHGVLRQRTGRARPRPGHVRLPLRGGHRAGRRDEAQGLDVRASGAGPGRVRGGAEAGRLRGPDRVPVLRGVRGWPGGARLAARVPPRARPGALAAVAAGARAPAGASARRGPDRPAGGRDPAVRHAVPAGRDAAARHPGPGRVPLPAAADPGLARRLGEPRPARHPRRRRIRLAPACAHALG